MRLNKKILIISVPIVFATAAIVFMVVSSFNKNEVVISGIVECTEIDVSSKIPGRLENIFVDEGDQVIKGDTLAILESTEMNAKLEQARAVMDAAKAKMNLVKNGARKEEKESVENLYMQAKAQFDYASKSYKRFQSLFKDHVISNQEFDEMEYKYNAAKEQMEAAKSKYEMVMKGARFEEIDAVESLYRQAENVYNEVSAYQKELVIKAPADGEVYQTISDAGEIINSGYPLLTILQTADSYVILQISEDKIHQMQKGKIFKGAIPALKITNADFEVSYVAPMGDFATWKPTNQKGDFDLKTFEIHLKSRTPINGLRPGMTVNIKI